MRRDPLPAVSLSAQYREACAQTDFLFDRVLPAFLTSRPVPERHRLLFYIGHLEAFDWNLLSKRLFDEPAFHPEFDHLFAFGIDPVGGGLPTDEPSDWPSLEEIYGYRDAVRERISARIPDVNFSHGVSSGGDDDAATLIQVIIEHRQMHAETLAYLLHQMPLEHKRGPRSQDAAATGSSGSAGRQTPRAVGYGIDDMITIPGGDAVLGLTAAPAETGGDRRFGWDNEFGTRQVAVPAFQIDRHMVSNGDFLRFVEAGGYQRQELWRDVDWAWLNTADAGHALKHPSFWRRDAQGWRQRTMFDDIPLPLDWPVYVSHAEARAYARFAGKRLPTEAEWLRAAEGAADFNRTPEEGNFDFRAWDPSPVHAHPANQSVFGVQGQFGNGWEWTADTFAPLPGFRPFSFYRGYSADFFDEHHFVMKGGSPRTAARMLRPSFRNWFQAHYPYAYVGVRCVRDVASAAIDADTDGDTSTDIYADTDPTGLVQHAAQAAGDRSTMSIPAHQVSLHAAFAADVRSGLGAQGQKTLPSSYLYDDVGSALFDAITALPEYGVTRAEERLLGQKCAALAQTLARDQRANGDATADDAVSPITLKPLRVMELGSGSGRKTRLILEALAAVQPVIYCPIDISGSALRQCCQSLADVPNVTITPFESDYLPGLAAAGAARRPGERTLVLFLGSTIGNFSPLAATRFLASIRATLQPGDGLLLGADLLKPIDVLVRAYDDDIGVTAAFNLNLLSRMNRELGANFDIRSFEHVARFNPRAQSIEMHLRSKQAQVVTIPASELSVTFAAGETIWTESSHKYVADDVVRMGHDAHFDVRAQWVDEIWPFAETLMTAR
jgi:dimethylhistidine N-methyltransferase